MAKLNAYILNRCYRVVHRQETRFYLKGMVVSMLLVIFFKEPAGSAFIKANPVGDSVKVAASKKYKAGLLRKIFIGKNYREVWSTPVNMPVFHLAESGMKITELGGGQQTKSLRLVDKQGVEWVLRTVDKDVEKALPEKIRGTLAQTVVQDMISAAHPYAPLVVAPLAKALGVSAPDPKLYYVPDDPAFGPHQKLFAHQVVYLEKRNPTPDNSDTKSTASVQENLGEDEGRLVLQRQVLRARLLDMLIADWDRHADQWRWGIQDSAGIKYYYAIPRDRDQAFFMSGGLIPRIGKAVAMHHLNWFKPKTKGLPNLNYKSREFDPLFLNDLDEQDWRQTVQEFQSTLSDEVIDKAVERLPQAVYQISGDFLKQRLKSRRNTMMNPVMDYYRMVAAEVQVWGTKKRELFTIVTEGDGVRVQVFALGKDGKKRLERYNRLFTRKETRALHLEGLGGNDRFEIGNISAGAPTIHLYGMNGNDVYVMEKENKERVIIHVDGGSPVPASVASNTGKEKE